MLIPPEMVPIAGTNAMFHNISGARQAMYTGNLDQRLITIGMTRTRQRSGLEREMAKGTFSHTFPCDAIVLAVIPRFQGVKFGEEFALNPKEIVIFENYETSQLDYIELTRYHVMHQHYGFEFKYDEEVYDRLKREIKPKFSAGTHIARSPGVTDDGDWMLGVEANVIRMSDPALTEDAIMISRSFANSQRSWAYETRTFETGRSHYPTNSYGNDNIYLIVPEIGQRIQSNGLICALRPFDPKLDPVYMTKKRLFKPVYNLDHLVYGKADAEVVDIKVYHNPHTPNKRLPDEMTKQLRKYYEADRRYYTAIIKTCLARRNGVIRESDDVDMTDRLRVLLDEAVKVAGDYLVEEELWPKDHADILRAKTNYRGATMDEYRVDITYRYLTEIGDGQKFTDPAGGKGIISIVREDEDMPIDDFGIRADVATFDGSTVNRQNNARDHSALVGAAGRDIIRRIRKTYGLGELAVLTKDEVKKAVLREREETHLKNFAYLMGFYARLAPTGEFKYLSTPNTIPSGRHISHLIEIILDGNDPKGLFLRMRSDQGLPMADIVKWIEESEYCPNMSQVWMTNHAGERVRTKEKFLIGPNVYMALEKTASDGSGVGSAKTNHFGVTSKLTNSDKHATPARETGTRSTGEAELRGEVKAVGPDIVADVTEMNNNPTAHKEVVNNILDSPTPTNIERVINRLKFLPEGHRPANFIKHIYACSGKALSRK